MSQFAAKIYPNGEFAVYRPKRFKPDGVKENHQTKEQEALSDLVELNKALGGRGLMDVYDNIEALEVHEDLGLSLHPNFDKPVEKSRYGLNGIPSRSAKKVRNGAYLLQKRCGNELLSFLTITMPSLPVDDMRLVHACWSKVVDSVKRKVTRALVEKGIHTEFVMVVEVQEKRYKETGIPVLHLHALFQGRKKFKTWAVTCGEFDKMWSQTLENILGKPVDVGSACNVQRVKASAEGYMGKYMSKGAKVVESVKAAGLEEWLPRQWWSMTRALSCLVAAKTKVLRDDSEFLWNACLDDDSPILLFCRPVILENKMGVKYVAAFYGRVRPEIYNNL